MCVEDWLHPSISAWRKIADTADSPTPLRSGRNDKYVETHGRATALRFLSSARKLCSLISIMRGFMPSRMEMTPSSIISLRRCSSRMRMLELAGGGQEEEIGGADAVDGGDEGDGDAAADLIDVVEVLHDLDEAEHRADDADGGREAAGGLEDGGNALFDLRLTLSISISMIWRSSEGSVPSTASMRAWLRKGSWIRSRSWSRETMPLRRALLAKPTIWRSEPGRRLSWMAERRGTRRRRRSRRWAGGTAA